MRPSYARIWLCLALATSAPRAQAQEAPPSKEPAVVPAPPAAAASTPHSVPPPVVIPPPTFATTDAPAQPVAAPRHGLRPPPQPEKRRFGDAGAPFTLGIGGALRFRSDDGFSALGAEKPQTELDLFASYDLLQPTRRLVFAAGIGYRHGRYGDEQAVSLTTHAVQADLIARYTLTRWLFPVARAGIGAQLSRAELRDTTADFRASDDDAGVTGSLGGGLLFQTPRRLLETYRGRLASLCLGFLVEGGYAFAGTSSYRLAVESDSDLASPTIQLGKLALGGAYLRLSAVLRI